MKHPTTRLALVAAFIGLVGTPLAVNAQQPAPPIVLAGSYTLAQVDDADLPVLIGETAECRGEITAATLTLEPDNRYRLQADVRETCGETVKEKVHVEQGTITSEGTSVTFTREEIPADPTQEKVAIDIDALTTATLEDNVLKVKLGETHTLNFRK